MDRGGVPTCRKHNPQRHSNYNLKYFGACIFSTKSVPKASQCRITASQFPVEPARALQRSAVLMSPWGRELATPPCAERRSARGPLSGVPVVSAKVRDSTLPCTWAAHSLQSPSTWEVLEALYSPGGKGSRRPPTHSHCR